LDTSALRKHHNTLVTCSISGWGSAGPSRDDPGWEPLVHARAGAQQGLFTGDRPIWLPFPMASVGAGLLALIGTGAALVKRESTGYGQHVETSLFEALLFLNGGAVFHRPRHPPPIVRAGGTPILRLYKTSDDRSMMVNFSGTERWRELCRLVGLEGDGGLDFADPKALAKLAEPVWCHEMIEELTRLFATRTGDEWEAALLQTPAATARCNTLEEWMGHEQARANGVFSGGLVAPPIRIATEDRTAKPPRRHGSANGALAGIRVVDLSSFWAGPLAARFLAELGADVVKVQPPGGEGAFLLSPLLPNIYVDGNRSKRGVTLELRQDEDRRRLLALVESADVVVENSVAGAWERLGLGEEDLRAANPTLVYARAKGFGLHGPLAARPTFDYVVQAATGMEMVQGGDDPQPVNFTANDYGTGLHLAAGIILALLARSRGAAVTGVEASLMTTATVFESEDVAAVTRDGGRRDTVGSDLRGPSPAFHLYECTDGWVAVCAVTADERAALDKVVEGLAKASVAEACAELAAHGVPAARSVHPGAVPQDVQVQDRGFLRVVNHPGFGPYMQVAVPLHLSDDPPAIRCGVPRPAR
jgi:crotonobetainyl-CoA:carnitine CoA-transferase CaiB-like acyl-CoA transferase